MSSEDRLRAADALTDAVLAWKSGHEVEALANAYRALAPDDTTGEAYLEPSDYPDLNLAARASAKPSEGGLDVETLTLAIMRADITDPHEGIDATRWELYAGSVATAIAAEYARLRESKP